MGRRHAFFCFESPSVTIAPTTARSVLSGFKAAIPIMIGYLPLAVTFGIAGTSIGLAPLQVLMISALVFAGASQFLLLASIQSGIGWGWVVMLCALLNLRHLLYGPLLSRMLPSRLRTRLLLAFTFSDEVFSIALNHLSSVGDKRGAWMTGLGGGAWMAWVGGTVLGAFAGAGFSREFPVVTEILAFALPALFLTLAIKSTTRASRASALVSALVAGALTLIGFSSQGILLGAFFGCAVYFFRHRKARA
jgi:4-azaleucine resistance transporter AzlC